VTARPVQASASAERKNTLGEGPAPFDDEAT
jgi:hypothetical protein